MRGDAGRYGEVRGDMGRYLGSGDAAALEGGHQLEDEARLGRVRVRVRVSVSVRVRV